MSKSNTSFGLSLSTIIVVAVLVEGINVMLGSSLYKGGEADMSDAAIAERLKPVAQLNTGAPITPEAPAVSAPAPVATGARSGQDVYQSVCFACHGTGAAGAPKMGDAAAWKPRIAKGVDLLLQHAVNGFQGNTGVMPARGTCGNCSDNELKSAIEYMVANSK